MKTEPRPEDDGGVSVYVDPLFEAKANAEGCEWCHMGADTVEEIHAFAAKIWRRRCWFEGLRRGCPHYDLTPSFRVKAVVAGAIEVSRTFFAERRIAACRAAGGKG